ncbi:ComF family protein [Acetobacter nitrogenifigens]|uniref:Amidophosphoribosyltransferase n=1 Tax=Acetobacter nitrogenifigens DSM 23921 = NBRC 105050 TaxID=1120919 RepID=A0A511XD52_9PROT|nr:ComF family protein [Acetobacter nitrogenifigens]GEN60886.1 amidophosphoribosyltransferase [Acetobacter nitrogenifigens DSM 23921 = NBRC 105050]
MPIMESAAGGALMRGARSVGRFALDLVLPPTCASCGTEVDRAGALCPDCFTRLRLIGAPRCDRCGVPLAADSHLGATSCCVRCERRPPVWSQARAAYVYDDASRDLILALKYADQTQNAAFLARQMARAGADMLADADLLAPVPVHWRRLLQRRYNQAALLARAVSRMSGVPALVDALRRPRATARLVGFSAAARAREMTEAITINPKRQALLAGRRVVLVDDVLTTGATASACSAVLLAAGAASVGILAAARTLRPETEDADAPAWLDERL